MTLREFLTQHCDMMRGLPPSGNLLMQEFVLRIGMDDLKRRLPGCTAVLLAQDEMVNIKFILQRCPEMRDLLRPAVLASLDAR